LFTACCVAVPHLLLFFSVGFREADAPQEARDEQNNKQTKTNKQTNKTLIK